MSDNFPIHPLQALVDGMGARWREERSQTQMTLGKLIAALEALPPDRRIQGIGEPMSYRGYYSDLAFEPDFNPRPIADLLTMLHKECMGQTFEGYKGGDFDMGARTPLWSAEYSMTGLRIMGLNVEADPITLILAEGEE